MLAYAEKFLNTQETGNSGWFPGKEILVNVLKET